MSGLKESNLLTRTWTGAVLVAVVVGAALLSEWTFAALMFVIALGCLREFYRLAEAAGFEPQKTIGFVFACVMIPGTILALVMAKSILPAGLVVLFPLITFVSLAAELYRNRKNPLGNVAATLLGVFYTVIPFALLSLTVFIPMGLAHPSRTILSCILIVWANDIGAYLVGVTCGKHRLFERISPKKSWEGFFGGVAVAVGVAVFAGWLQGDPLWKWAALGALIAVAGVAGDLAESMLKRAVGLKDSGRIMPGHGGFLDRFDALIFAAPFIFIFFLCWNFFTA